MPCCSPGAYRQSFHGPLRKADLDAISSTRPIIVWHRSAHEVYLNSAAERKHGITREWFDELPDSPRKQSDFDNAHDWEQGMFSMLPKIGAAIASPERIQAGLKFVRKSYHANGVTLDAEPGGLMSKPLQDAQNAVLGDPSSPFPFAFSRPEQVAQIKRLEAIVSSNPWFGWGRCTGQKPARPDTNTTIPACWLNGWPGQPLEVNSISR
jgi:hypothetical protein